MNYLIEVYKARASNDICMSYVGTTTTNILAKQFNNAGRELLFTEDHMSMLAEFGNCMIDLSSKDILLIVRVRKGHNEPTILKDLR